MEALERDRRLASYPYLPATKADLLHRLGRSEEATRAYHAAHELSDNAAERDFLAERARETPPSTLALAWLSMRAPIQLDLHLPNFNYPVWGPRRPSRSWSRSPRPRSRRASVP